MSTAAVEDEVVAGTETGAEETQNQVEDSSLGMSDEDFLKAGPPADPVVEAPAAEAAVKVEGAEGEAQPQGGEDGAGEGAADQASDKPATDEATKQDESQEKAPAATTAAEAKPAETDKDEPKAAEAAVDYKAQYEKLLAPFKANGREVQVQSVDDAITLMQMGANYNKKMAALKPNLKLMKLLENNGFLDEEKIGFLIDLGKKDPAAINKLVKDSGIDPMDLSAEKASAYKQTAYAVDDKELELDTVLEEIKPSATYTRTLDVVSNKWDAASKQHIANNPQLLKVINSHMEAGIYDQISKELESERLFGRLNGLSDLEAYRKVGDAIHARGGFNPVAPAGAPEKPTAAAPAISAPKPSKAEQDKLNEKRRAASSTKPAAPAVKPKDFNPLAMSDEEFSKQATSMFR